MKYIKAYKLFENLNSELELKLKEFKIENYTINEDSSIDKDGSIFLHYLKLKKIPFKFGKVGEYFLCNSNYLMNLKGCASEVGNGLYCMDNQLTSLEGCASEVGGDFNCGNNKLTSLEFAPLEIGDDLICSHNQLTMLDCSSYVKGDIFCKDNGFTEEPEFFGDCEGKIKWK